MDIDYSRDSLFDELGIKRLRDSYMRPEETSPQDRFAYVSKEFASNEEHAQRLYDYSSKHWLSYSTPILSFGRNKRGMPISCYLNFLNDTAEGLVDNLSETNWLSMMGGGVGIHVGIRGSDDKSVGVMPHLKVYDASSLAYKQGTTRRGSYAAYLDVSHPDIIQFLEMRKPTGDQNMRTLNLNHAINISDKFMQIIENCMVDPSYNDSWDLVQPNSGNVVETVSAKDLWMRILEMRMQTGEPYLWFNDTANRALPEYQKKLGLSIKGSNLCLTGDTLIDVRYLGKEYKIQLEEFVVKFEMGFYPEVEIKSYNGCEVVWSKVTVAAKTAVVDELYEIETPAGHVIRCTSDHKIFTKNRGYVEAKNLLETDELLY